MIVAGLMSGTSADGVDVAVCQIEGAPPHLEIGLLSSNQAAFAPDLLAKLMSHPHPALSPPKTTGWEAFGPQFGEKVWQRAKAQGLADVDILAALTAFTAQSIAQAYHCFLPSLDEVILGGGGAHNPVLRGMLEQALAPARVLRHEDVGLPSAAKEAVAFAVLAYEAWHRRPGNLPSATGAAHRTVLGKISLGRIAEEKGYAGPGH